MTDGLPQLSDVLRRLGQELTRRSVGVELRWVWWAVGGLWDQPHCCLAVAFEGE